MIQPLHHHHHTLQDSANISTLNIPENRLSDVFDGKTPLLLPETYYAPAPIHLASNSALYLHKTTSSSFKSRPGHTLSSQYYTLPPSSVDSPSKSYTFTPIAESRSRHTHENQPTYAPIKASIEFQSASPGAMPFLIPSLEMNTRLLNFNRQPFKQHLISEPSSLSLQHASIPAVTQSSNSTYRRNITKDLKSNSKSRSYRPRERKKTNPSYLNTDLSFHKSTATSDRIPDQPKEPDAVEGPTQSTDSFNPSVANTEDSSRAADQSAKLVHEKEETQEPGNDSSNSSNKKRRRPINAFMAYVYQQRNALHEEGVEFDNKEFLRDMSKKWRESTPEERRSYGDIGHNLTLARDQDIEIGKKGFIPIKAPVQLENLVQCEAIPNAFMWSPIKRNSSIQRQIDDTCPSSHPS